MNDIATETNGTQRLVFPTKADTHAHVPDFLLRQHGIERQPTPIEEPEVPVEIEAAKRGRPKKIKEPDLAPEIQEEKEPAPVAAPSIEDMTIQQLKNYQDQVEAKLRQKIDAEKRMVIDQIVKTVNTYSIPVDELVEALGGFKVRRKGIKAVAKFRDPDTGITWSGRGKEPTWIRDKDREEFRIPEGEIVETDEDDDTE